MRRGAAVSVVWFVLVLGLATHATLPGLTGGSRAAAAARDEIPTFEYDPAWPKQLPNNWTMGNIGAMAMGPHDHVWVVQRPASTTGLGERFGLTGDAECCFPAPPVLEFDAEGSLIQAFGPIHGDAKPGADQAVPTPQVLLGKQVSAPYPEDAWPPSEHGIFVDYKGNVWVDSQNAPSQLTKLTHDGKFIMRIGKHEAASSNDPENLAGPTGIFVDPKTNEVYVADGYRNRRVIVFDADTGAYKRHWGAYGKRPADGPQSLGPVLENKNFYDPTKRADRFAIVHCIVQGRDGLLYVCDRANNRIQVFKTDGTFVKEAVVAAETRTFGAVHAIGFSADAEQRFLYVADGANHKVWILRREDLKVIGSFGKGGRGGGQLLVAHALVVDSKGNVYVGETIDNNRVQKFKFTGMRRISGD